jgi:cyclase
MLRPRVIPSLLMDQGRLVKTVRFAEPKYVGDPINAVRIFNEKEVDELCLFDIGASKSGAAPDFQLIQDIAAQCRMPLSYGGGVRTVDEARRIIELGVEKVALNTAALARPELVAEIAERVGAQSVAVVLDVKQKGPGRYGVAHRGALAFESDDVRGVARYFSENGAGEVIINSIDRDGTLAGYDLDLVAQVRDVVSTPLTVLGGAADMGSVRALVDRFGIIGAAAGSMFVFKGKLRAVLINYPRREELQFTIA